MSIALAAISILHLLDLVILITSTAANAWIVDGDLSADLWYKCTSKNGGYHCKQSINEDWLQAVQALMVLAVLFCLLSFVFFLCQLFTLVKGGRFYFTAVFQILASLFVMSGAIIFTVMNYAAASSSYGYAYVLAWLAFPLTLGSGLIYIILRKTE
ncbi:peripheral myelin protein 22a [Clupea harengus]|uniref:Peripheral myelin protein 22a n=1 Tax=Clupea harengus TaxID=7950 RepID=A0A6P3VTS7_CLUHA|nr:peripheral myelin protein 22a [Clupea harengus]